MEISYFIFSVWVFIKKKGFFYFDFESMNPSSELFIYPFVDGDKKLI